MNASPKNKRAFSALLVLFTLLLVSGSAFAKKRVVVLDFKGPAGSKAEAAVVDAVKKKHTVVSAGQYNKAKKKLKAKKTTDKNVAKIAAEIQVDAVVSGVVKRKGAKYTLTVTVREGLSGKIKGKAAIALRAPKIDAKAKKDIMKRVPALVGKTRSISGDEAAPDEDDEDASSDDEEEVASDDEEEDSSDDEEASADDEGGEEVAMASDEDEEPKKKREQASDESSAAADDDEPVPGIDDEKSSKKVASASDDSDVGSSVTQSAVLGAGPDGGDRFARHAGASVRLGVAATGRNLSFNAANGVQPAGYEGGVVPGAMVAVELYPFAFGNPSGALAGLGVTGSYDQVFGLKSEIDDMGTVKQFDTTQTRFDVGLVYRLNFGSSPTSPTLNLSVGYGQLAFAIPDKPADTKLPDVTYTYFDPGASIRLPLGSPRFALNAGARFLAINGLGDMGEEANYGAAKVLGVDADGGLEIRLTSRLPLHLGARYMRIAYDFNGVDGALIDADSDGDADVGGALDVYIGGYATLGYLF